LENLKGHIRSKKEINDKNTKDLENFRAKTSAAIGEVSSLLAILEEPMDADELHMGSNRA
jgi:hypothetical protein